MGAVVYPGGAMFRVWAPNASTVAVTVGAGAETPLASGGNGYWSADLDGVAAGDEYRFLIDGVSKNDPYARDVTSSVGNSVVVDPAFDWGDAPYRTPPWHELVIYELHVGTFNDAAGGLPGSFASVVARLDHLHELGINAVELMPSMEFAADFSWGYNPSHIFAVESAYGGPDGLKQLVKAAHERGIAVIGDVVYNHLGPSDLDLWRFDGWHQGEGGGIYFYNDARSQTPWGDTRPDYGRPEVRAFLRDNARYWLEECRLDGLRWDATAYIRNTYGNNDDPAHDIPDGWRLMQEITADTDGRQPWKLHIAEDLRANRRVTRATHDGGAGFDTQWDSEFVHPVRAVLKEAFDGGRSMDALRRAITHSYGGNPLARVIYTESHDEVANGHARLPEEISRGDAGNWFARKRSTLGAVLVFTSPGIPMIFQGQEFLEDEWFRDTDPLDWTKATTYSGVLRLYRDLVFSRRNLGGSTGGLRGSHVNVHHVNDGDNVIAFHRWDGGGPGDDVVVVVNVSNRAWADYRIGLPAAGEWRVRVNTDWKGYGADYENVGGIGVVATAGEPRDGMAASASLAIGRYSALILSREG